MNYNTLFSCVLAGLCFGGWQLVMRASGLKDPMLAAFLLNIATVITFIPFMRGRIDVTTLFSYGVVLALIAGLINGFGHVVFQRLVLAREEELVRFGAVVPAIVVLVSVAGAVAFYGEILSGKKIFGVVLVLAGIKFLAMR